MFISNCMSWLYWFLFNDPILYLVVCSYCFEETANIADVWKCYCSTELLCILNDLSIKWRYMLLHRWLQVGIFCIWLYHCVVFWIWYPFSFILWNRYFSVFILNENLSRKLINKWIKSRGNNQNLDLELIFLIQEKKQHFYMVVIKLRWYYCITFCPTLNSLSAYIFLSVEN